MVRLMPPGPSSTWQPAPATPGRGRPLPAFEQKRRAGREENEPARRPALPEDAPRDDGVPSLAEDGLGRRRFPVEPQAMRLRVSGSSPSPCGSQTPSTSSRGAFALPPVPPTAERIGTSLLSSSRWFAGLQP